MNKEFIGKKRFYLNEHPETFVDARIYVIETRNSEYFSAVLENGNAYRIEFLEPLCGELPDIESFTDLEGQLFIEFQAKTIENISFFDRKSNKVGTGQVTAVKIKNQMYYIGQFTSERSFKYKCNGWDYTRESGDHLIILMHPGKILSPVVSCTASILGRSGKVEMNVLKNDYFQVHCYGIPEKLM